jgi:hypothetical protein
MCSRLSLTVLPQVFSSQGGHRHVSSATLLVAMVKEASRVGLLPHREPGTRSAPGVDYFGVRPRVGANPLKQVEDQGVYCVRHGNLLICCCSNSLKHFMPQRSLTRSKTAKTSFTNRSHCSSHLGFIPDPSHCSFRGRALGSFRFGCTCDLSLHSVREEPCSWVWGGRKPSLFVHLRTRQLDASSAVA